MKGIILAGGSGTRLYPMTKGLSKQLLPIYDKPMIYYPLSVLMLAGIKDILIITTPEDSSSFKRLLKDGRQFGISIKYAVQEKPNGIAEAFLIGEKFIRTDDVALILGDNIFHGANFSTMLTEAVKITEEKQIAQTFGYYVSDPERYGVANFNKKGECIGIEEKPKKPKSNYAVVGLYFYPYDVVEKAKQIKPSARGELEITSLNDTYLQEKRLMVHKLPRGFAWLDTGTVDSFFDATQYIGSVEKRQGLKIGCTEEIAYGHGWISTDELKSLAEDMGKSDYGKYLKSLIDR